MRVEKSIVIVADRQPSDKYPNKGWAFDLQDEDGIMYEWNTTSFVDCDIIKGQKWIVRMTVEDERDVCGYKYHRVNRVRFVEKISK